MNHNAHKVKQLHREAMEFADEADLAELFGDRKKFLRLTEQAFEKEKAAADLMEDIDVEPSRSVLHRSAATLAWRCGFYDRSEKLIYRALAGNPRSDIEWQLKDLLGTVNLAKAGVHLGEGQLQFSLHGSQIGNGKAAVEDLTSRAPSIATMLRISAKSALQCARDAASSEQPQIGDIPVFIEGLAAGSCIVKLRLGDPIQDTLPGFWHYSDAIKPFFEYVNLLEQGESDELEKIIDDPDGYRDFVKASIELAPDGKNISSVKFQSVIDDSLRVVSLNTTQNSLKGLPLPDIPSAESKLEVTEHDIVKTGVLRVGNALENEKKTLCILATDGDGNWHIEGAEDLKDEIVRRYFKRRVVVHGKRMKRANVVRHVLVMRIEDVRLYAEKDFRETSTGASKTLI
ncbi:MAG: hypothetical protein OXI77_14340 [Chloroflexota bacterium]|nr:hypothetical protein [Chloroflexota bacterium]MDE2910651.1 hypothetical protein [Chloroflexota bacterium]